MHKLGHECTEAESKRQGNYTENRLKFVQTGCSYVHTIFYNRRQPLGYSYLTGNLTIKFEKVFKAVKQLFF